MAFFHCFLDNPLSWSPSLQSEYSNNERGKSEFSLTPVRELDWELQKRQQLKTVLPPSQDLCSPLTSLLPVFTTRQKPHHTHTHTHTHTNTNTHPKLNSLHRASSFLIWLARALHKEEKSHSRTKSCFKHTHTHTLLLVAVLACFLRDKVSSSCSGCSSLTPAVKGDDGNSETELRRELPTSACICVTK